jgi:hypothetical protein
MQIGTSSVSGARRVVGSTAGLAQRVDREMTTSRISRSTDGSTGIATAALVSASETQRAVGDVTTAFINEVVAGANRSEAAH